MDFLSEQSEYMHREYLRKLKLEYSIFEKSYPEIVGKNCREILYCRAISKRAEREEAVNLKAEILAHELFFSSFSTPNQSSVSIKKYFGSQASFLYELSERCMKTGGFMLLYVDTIGKIGTYAGNQYTKVFLDNRPILAIDLFEHAYFYDYGFDKRSYVNTALQHLNFASIEN